MRAAFCLRLPFAVAAGLFVFVCLLSSASAGSSANGSIDPYLDPAYASKLLALVRDTPAWKSAEESASENVQNGLGKARLAAIRDSLPALTNLGDLQIKTDTGDKWRYLVGDSSTWQTYEITMGTGLGTYSPYSLRCNSTGGNLPVGASWHYSPNGQVILRTSNPPSQAYPGAGFSASVSDGPIWALTFTGDDPTWCNPFTAELAFNGGVSSFGIPNGAYAQMYQTMSDIDKGTLSSWPSYYRCESWSLNVWFGDPTGGHGWPGACFTWQEPLPAVSGWHARWMDASGIPNDPVGVSDALPWSALWNSRDQVSSTNNYVALDWKLDPARDAIGSDPATIDWVNCQLLHGPTTDAICAEPPAPNYVALGDSYSSGEGNPPYLPGSDGNGDYCHRSPNAYAFVLGVRYGTAPFFYACSGAKTLNITGNTYEFTEPPQTWQPGVDTSADLVTMTIGGNDAGFSSVLKACIKQRLDPRNTTVGGWIGLGGDPSCANSDEFVMSVIEQIKNVFEPVESTYRDVLGAVDPVNTSVVVADYPHLFSNSPSLTCTMDVFLTREDQDFLNSAGTLLNAVLERAAREAGVNFVDVGPAFEGHEICSGDISYLNGISITSLNGSFHPNAFGHLLGYGLAIDRYINSAQTRTRAGFPANPTPLPNSLSASATTADGVGELTAQAVSADDSAQTRTLAGFTADSTPLPDPLSAPVIPALGVGELTAQPVSGGSPDCEGTFQAGQKVSFSGEGFVPESAVRLFVSSPGLGSSGELEVAEVTADDNGDIAGTVRIPLSATGFTQDGAAAGLVFLDAIGEGSAAAHQDDVAMVGLASHTSSCGTVEELPFSGFDPPVANPPHVNAAQPGRAIPVKFSIRDSDATLDDVLAAGYPQSAAVSCSAPEDLTSGDPTASVGNSSQTPGDDYNYVWKTDRSFRGCRELIVKLVDGSYHRAVFNFGK
jgi:hypothetical protein